MCSDTYTNEKTSRASADHSTSAATSVETNDASSAFCAESARRRRLFHAAYEPATSAYATRPRLRRSAARPSVATYVVFFAGAYFDGHFVVSEFAFATKTPSRTLPVTTTSRPTRYGSGTEPW